MQNKKFFPLRQSFYFVKLFSMVIVSTLTGGCALHSPIAVPEKTSTSCIQVWPQNESDLSADPDLIFGSLENGLRYVVRQNKEPRGRVALYLDIQAGSLHETDRQRGIAHYLEHMLFNGTKHYPPGTLVEYFQSIGMSFGADTNAHTGYDETVYKLLLPSGSKETLDEGLLVLADYARGALLLEEEVEKERGIILSEKRSRDSAAARVAKNSLQHEFAGSLIVERDPIGTEEIIRTADSALLRSYYDTWYRPENMVVVLVGDTDPESAVERIRNFFSPLVPAATEPTPPAFGQVNSSGTDISYQYEPDLGYTEIGISTTWNVSPQADTTDWEKVQLQNYIAAALLDNRLQHLVNEGRALFSQANAYAGLFVQRFGYFGLTARTGKNTWSLGLSRLEQTLRQVLEQGVSATELERVKRELKGELEKNARIAESRDSGQLAMEIIHKINNNEVILSPSQEQELYGRLLDTMSVDDIESALHSIWDDARRIIKVSGTTDLRGGTISPERRIQEVLSEAKATALQAWQADDKITFPYLSPPEQIASVQEVINFPRIKTMTTVLSSGLHINVKSTDFKKDEVMIAVHFGEGKLSEPILGLSKLAESVIHESGIGKLTREQLEEVLAGRNGRVQFAIGPESFVFRGKGLSTELELMLQLIATNLTDPAFRIQAYKRSMERFEQMYKAMQHSVEGTVQLQGERFFTGDDPTSGWPSRKDFLLLNLKQVRQWLEPVFHDAGLEVSVVGDVDPDTVVALVRKYLGNRSGDKTVRRKRPSIRFPQGEERVLALSSQVDKAMVVIGWPTDDFWDIFRTRRLSVLASVLEDRMRRTVREQLGATYSPVAYNFSSRVDKGFGVLRCYLTVATSKISQIRNTMMSIAETLNQKGVTAEEMQRTLAPINTSIKDLQRTNEYWLESVLALSGRHPEQLQWPMSIRTDFAAISKDQINAFARQYLQAEKAATLIVYSQKEK